MYINPRSSALLSPTHPASLPRAMLGAVLTAVLFSSMLVPGSDAALGPTADLVISNKIISPDGFPRSYDALYPVLRCNL